MKKNELIEQVADYYRSKNHRRWHLKPKEEKLISDRIKDGYTLDELKMAIDGLHITDWNMGNNPSGKKYLSLYYALHEDKIDSRIEKAQEVIDSRDKERLRLQAQAQKDQQREQDRVEMQSLSGDLKGQLVRAMRKKASG